MLFLLAPFVGEFLLGNLTLAELPLGLVLAPLYGFGAILVRELGRRSGGWPTMALLAVAYALIEEGPVDQLLWNSHYAGVDYVQGPGHVAAFGLNVMTVQVVIALHAVWSICVPIAITEALYPHRGARPWLTRRGLVAVGLLYAAGAGLVCWGNWTEERFWASPAQIGSLAIVISILIVTALRLRPAEVSVPRAAPHPGWVAVLGLVFTSAYWGPLNLISSRAAARVGFVVWWVVLLVGVGLTLGWSARQGWGLTHRYALAAGATLTYVWVAFPLRPEGGGSRTVDLSSNVVFGVVALAVLRVAARRSTRDRPSASPR